METLRILFFNWKDIKHPGAGGAEQFTHEVARRWARQGHTVGLFTSRFRGSKERDEIDDVIIYRSGSRLSVYRHAVGFWRRLRAERYDIVIDEINTRPFMTPAFINSGTRIFALIHQLAREYWFHETLFPVSFLGYYLLEQMWLAKYVSIPCVTVSESTKNDLVRLGFKDIHVVPEGLSAEPLKELPRKQSAPTLVYVGRLTRAKQPDVVLDSFNIIRKKIPDARLWIIGSGYLRKNLEHKASQGVTFFGKVTDDEKLRLLREAHALLVPSIREGWGLVVLEANAMATPAVAYDVPGLRDSVINGVTGILVDRNDARSMAEWCVRLIEDSDLRTRLSSRALQWSRKFSWDRTAEHFMSFLKSR